MAANYAIRREIRKRLHLPRATGGGVSARGLQIAGVLAGGVLIAIAILGATGYGVYRSYANDLKPPDEVIAQQPSGGAQIFDRHGNLLYEYVDDRSGLRSPVTRASTPAASPAPASRRCTCAPRTPPPPPAAARSRSSS